MIHISQIFEQYKKEKHRKRNCEAAQMKRLKQKQADLEGFNKRHAEEFMKHEDKEKQKENHP